MVEFLGREIGHIGPVPAQGFNKGVMARSEPNRFGRSAEGRVRGQDLHGRVDEHVQVVKVRLTYLVVPDAADL